MGDIREIEGDFDAADGLLWKASAQKLGALGPMRIRHSGRMGPLIELAIAQRYFPAQYACVELPAIVSQPIIAALERETISGHCPGSVLGAFPIARLSSAAGQDEWEQWCMKFGHAAQAVGFPKSFADGLIGAAGELQDNVVKHSEHLETGIVVYANSPGQFEFVVADGGIGMLASLKSNPEHRHLAHAGDALLAVVQRHASRFGLGSGHGTGIKQLFQSLIGVEGQVRLRSGDHALGYSGSHIAMDGRLELGQKGSLPGVTISVLCRTPGVALNR